MCSGSDGKGREGGKGTEGQLQTEIGGPFACAVDPTVSVCSCPSVPFFLRPAPLVLRHSCASVATFRLSKGAYLNHLPDDHSRVQWIRRQRAKVRKPKKNAWFKPGGADAFCFSCALARLLGTVRAIRDRPTHRQEKSLCITFCVFAFALGVFFKGSEGFLHP